MVIGKGLQALSRPTIGAHCGAVNGTVRLGRLRGIPIGAHWSVLVIVALVADMLATSILPSSAKDAPATAYWTVGVLVAAAFLLSLVAHEIAHAIVAQRAGMTVEGITLWMLGGVTALDGDPPDPRADLRIAVLGPAVSLGCGLASGAVAVTLHAIAAPRVVVAGVGWLAVTNVLLAAFNLLPGAPLDGGRVLRALVWRRTGDRDRAEQVATRGGRATGLMLVWAGIAEAIVTANILSGLWLVLIGWFLVSAAAAERDATVGHHALDGLAVSDVMETSFTWLPAYLDVAVAARRAVEVDGEYFPVCDFEGHPVAFVSVSRLVERVRRGRADAAKVLDVAVPITSNMTTAPDEPILTAVRRAGTGGLIAVVDHSRLVGIVTPTAISRAVRRDLVGSASTDR
jgi:Zn-dependent protease/CBS domain-containing protein